MENAPLKKFGVILCRVKLHYVPPSSPLRLTAVDRADHSPLAVSNADAVSGSKLVHLLTPRRRPNNLIQTNVLEAASRVLRTSATERVSSHASFTLARTQGV